MMQGLDRTHACAAHHPQPHRLLPLHARPRRLLPRLLPRRLTPRQRAAPVPARRQPHVHTHTHGRCMIAYRLCGGAALKRSRRVKQLLTSLRSSIACSVVLPWLTSLSAPPRQRAERYTMSITHITEGLRFRVEISHFQSYLLESRTLHSFHSFCLVLTFSTYVDFFSL